MIIQFRQYFSGTHIDGDAVVEPLADDGFSLDVDVLSVLNRYCLDVHTVQIERDGSGLDTQADLVPVSVE